MTGLLAVLCPGQGGQHPRMFDVLAEEGTTSCTKAPLDQWALEERLSMPVDAALSDASSLFSNRLAQPLIVAATMMAWERVKAVLPTPALVIGYSVGELSAYGVAGALPPSAALSLAAVRAQLMDECALSSPPQALLAVSGLNLTRIAETAAHAALYVAIETGPDSAIVGGFREQAQAYALQVSQAGGSAVLLPITIASHTPLMKDAVAPFLDALGNSPFDDPVIPVLSGVQAAPVRRRDTAMQTLSQQLDECIRWKDCMDSCAEAGITVAIELGPGSALARMLQKRHPHIACRSVDDFRSVEGMARWIGRHIER